MRSGPSTGGRPPRQLTFHADGGHVLVADLGATSIDVAVTTLDGRILGHHDEPARIEAGPEHGLGPRRRAVRLAARDDAGSARPAVGDRDRRPRPGRVRGRPPDLAADHARLGRLPDPRALRRPLPGAGLGRQRRQRPGARRVAVRASRPATTTSSSSRSGPGSAPGSSRTGTSIAARRGVPGTSATSRSSTTRRSSAAAATSAVSRRSPVARRSAAPVRRRRSTAGVRGCGPRSTSAGR